MEPVGVIGVFLGLVSIGLSIYIAYRQGLQLHKMEQIGADTHDTAEKIRSDARTHAVVRTFFSLGIDKQRSYKCLFPVSYNKRPLPYIVVGDYNALHVIQSLMGITNINLTPVNSSSQEIQTPISENVIYLCTPQSNPALNHVAPALNLPNDISPSLDGVALPCWFANENSRKLIYLVDDKRRLLSPAEKEYDLASQLVSGQIHQPLADTTTDYAILLRMTINQRKVIVIAGIHQYGTWIAGDFFRMLTGEQKLAFSNIFLSDEDFVSVIWGEYSSKSFSVTRCNVLQDLIWTRRGDSWGRAPSNLRQSALTMQAPDGLLGGE